MTRLIDPGLILALATLVYLSLIAWWSRRQRLGAHVVAIGMSGRVRVSL